GARRQRRADLIHGAHPAGAAGDLRPREQARGRPRASAGRSGARRVTRRPEMLRRVLTLALLVPLTWLTPLAYASPPDQTWIGGFYDDADYDDVVLLALSLAVALADTAPALDPHTLLVPVLLLLDAQAVPLVAGLGTPSRAPPLA